MQALGLDPQDYSEENNDKVKTKIDHIYDKRIEDMRNTSFGLHFVLFSSQVM